MNFIMKFFKKKSTYLMIADDHLGLDWSAMKVDCNGLPYFDCGNVKIYPWSWSPVMDVFKDGFLVEENITHTHPIYGRELHRRFLLKGRHNNVFPEDEKTP